MTLITCLNPTYFLVQKAFKGFGFDLKQSNIEDIGIAFETHSIAEMFSWERDYN